VPQHLHFLGDAVDARVAEQTVCGRIWSASAAVVPRHWRRPGVFRHYGRIDQYFRMWLHRSLLHSSRTAIENEASCALSMRQDGSVAQPLRHLCGDKELTLCHRPDQLYISVLDAEKTGQARYNIKRFGARLPNPRLVNGHVDRAALCESEKEKRRSLLRFR